MSASYVAVMTATSSDPTPLSRPLDRRRFLQAALAVGAGATLSPFGSLAQRVAAGAGVDEGAGYGPLRPTIDHTTGRALISLPRGFEYLTFGWAGHVMSDGIRTPDAHDGMGAFRVGDRVHLVRNHEKGNGSSFAPSAFSYDAAAGGGTTTLVFDPGAGRLVESYASLAGTSTNCAGGVTPHGTWLTCEETFGVSTTGTRHGYVFEVPASGVASPVPLRSMGRFKREATATDPVTGIVYMTEDEGASALYRYVPRDVFDLGADGVVQAMKVDPSKRLTKTWTTGASADVVEWVTIPDPDPAPGAPTVRAQAFARGAAEIARGEGAWFGNGVVYVVSTNGGPAGLGQVFALDTAARDVHGRLRLDGLVRARGAGQRVRQPARRDRPLRGRRRHRVRPRADARRSDLSLRPQRPQCLGVGGRHLRAEERQLALREPADARHHLRHHRSLASGGAVTVTVSRHIDCDGAFNLRDLGGYRTTDGRTVRWRTLFRADGLHRVTGPAIATIRELRCRTVLDLRTSIEVDAGQYRADGVDVVHLPLLRETWDEGALRSDADDPVAFLADRYLEMAETGPPAIAAAFELIASSRRLPLAFHCSAGKDRTGVLAALVLSALGVDDDQIASDYALSAMAMDRLVAWIGLHRPEAAEHMARQPSAFLACPPAAILRFLDGLRERHGGVRLYLGDIGVDRATVESLAVNVLTD